MITIVTGLPGASKSYMLAQQAVNIVKRNKRWYRATGTIRQLKSNLVFSDKFTQWANEEHEFVSYWEDPEELPGMKNADVIWEEMGAHVDSRSWESLPLTLRRWLQQHRHRGIEIWGNCQDFSDVDVAIRRLTGRLLYLTKIVGSRDPSPTTPPLRFIWGVVAVTSLDPRNYEEDKKLARGTFQGFQFITREGVELYSMHNDIKPGKYPALQHRERRCNDCGYVKTAHV